MIRTIRLASIALVGIAWIAGCSGINHSVPQTPPPGSGTAPVSLLLTDTPPAGVTVLAFTTTVTSAVLNPGSVPLLHSPASVEIRRLETENAFLDNVNVPAGTYTSLALTLTNTTVAFKNDSGAVIAGCPGSGSANVCQSPAIATSSATINFSPSPLSVTANQPAALVVDIHLGQVITAAMGVDLTAAGGVTLSSSTVGHTTDPLASVEELTGQVVSVDGGNRFFQLDTSLGLFTLNVGLSTTFSDFLNNGCSSANIGCLLANQIVNVDYQVLGDGSLLATEVRFKDQNGVEPEIEGVIVSGAGGAPFTMAVLEANPAVSGVALGQAITVTTSLSTTFDVDAEGFSTGGFTFASASDTLVGQQVSVHATTVTSTNLVADRVRLRLSRFTATVAAAPSGSNFNVNVLPSLFTASGTTQIQVQTATGLTEFVNVSAVGSLTAGNIVSLRGLLFKNGGSPVLIASKVIRRS